MTSVTVQSQQHQYEILLSAGLLTSEEELIGALSSIVADRSCMIVGDSNTLGFYKSSLENALHAAGCYQVVTGFFHAGENSKQLATVERLCREAARANLGRNTVVFALGGGVTGDVAGFFAATYLRGVPFVQVPTSLLAMVDSSVGGKVAVDLPEGKNLVGAFYQPRLVLTDLSTLETLPPRERRCGLAETVKTAVLFDADLFDLIEKEADHAIADVSPWVYEEMVRRCCAWKARIVAEDEYEGGKRAILNYGHTFGHAIETLSNYATYNHGEAVAVGMGMAADFAVTQGLCAPEVRDRQDAVLRRLGLPVECDITDIMSDDMLKVMFRDKKVQSSRLRLVLPRAIGQVEILEVEELETVKKAIEGRFG